MFIAVTDMLRFIAFQVFVSPYNCRASTGHRGSGNNESERNAWRTAEGPVTAFLAGTTTDDEPLLSGLVADGWRCCWRCDVAAPRPSPVVDDRRRTMPSEQPMLRSCSSSSRLSQLLTPIPASSDLRNERPPTATAISASSRQRAAVGREALKSLQRLDVSAAEFRSCDVYLLPDTVSKHNGRRIRNANTHRSFRQNLKPIAVLTVW